MSENRTLPEAFQEKVNTMPEYSHGVTRIRVILKDGSRYSDVFVAWGSEIVKVGTTVELPFDPLRIVAVERQ